MLRATERKDGAEGRRFGEYLACKDDHDHDGTEDRQEVRLPHEARQLPGDEALR